MWLREGTTNTFFKYTYFFVCFQWGGNIALWMGERVQLCAPVHATNAATHHLPEGILQGTSDGTLHGDLPLRGPDGRLKLLLQWVGDEDVDHVTQLLLSRVKR